MKVMLDEGAYMPKLAHSTDAGYDIQAKEVMCIPPHSSAIFHTGVHVQLSPGTVGLLWSKSGLNMNHNIISTGVIDEGYTGEIVVKLYNLGNKYYVVHSGDKITQLLIQPVLHEKLEQVDVLEETERGANGFGSTGR